jgi:hypothetical protein
MSNSATLSLQTIDYPFETLVQRASANPPKLILDPEFQRKYKWDKDGWERASKFIESCLMRIPLPSCYFAENDDKSHIVIDGVQRITTIIKYMNDEFSLEGLTAFPDLEGKRFSEIGSLGRDLESTTIRCIVLRNENPKNLVVEIFSRLNKGAVELSDQEIRHALYPGDFDRLLHDLSQIDIIKNFRAGRTGEPKQDSREGEELVLRYFAFTENGSLYTDTLSKFLDAYMEEAVSYDAVKIERLRKNFVNSLSACRLIFNDEEIFSDISSDRKRQGLVYYDLLMGSLGDLKKSQLKSHRDEIRRAFMELCTSEEFSRLTAGGLQRRRSVARRNELWREKLTEALS